ncbi:MAG: hypothetical protein ACP5RH_14430 [Leptodesmis sp.]|uniref:hypothetical protein n=1 Tax=Leptodesmis sp. TaxID=3100501 RepID=UPI003D129B77
MSERSASGMRARGAIAVSSMGQRIQDQLYWNVISVRSPICRIPNWEVGYSEVERQPDDGND